MTNLIYGGPIVKTVKARCTQKNYFVGKTVSIIRFQPPFGLIDPIQLAYYKAATTSTEQKTKTFRFLGCNVEQPYLPDDTSTEAIKSLINKTIANPNLLGIIVQNPIPRRLKSKITKQIPPSLDLDGVTPNHSLFQASATSVAIARLVQSFATYNERVAVVGGKGFVGKGVIKILSNSGIECINLDYGDDLTRTNEADIVVSATGVPELLDSQHIKPEHKLVVDSGFIPISDKILGDVNRSAYSIPQNITPVPGGVGPLQMAILLERIMSVAKLPIQEWDYKKDVLEKELRSSEELSSRRSREEYEDPTNRNQSQPNNSITNPQNQRLLAKELLELGCQIFDESAPEKKIEVSPGVWEVRGQLFTLRFDRNNRTFRVGHGKRGDLLNGDLRNKDNISIYGAIFPRDIDLFKAKLRLIEEEQRQAQKQIEKQQDWEL